MKQYIFILGASWNVGRELVKQIITRDGEEFHKNPSIIVWIANSRSYIFSQKGIKGTVLKKISNSRDSARKIFWKQATSFEGLSELIDCVQNADMDESLVFVDVTAGKQDLSVFHKKIIQETSYNLVTANKNPISLYNQEDFNTLTLYTGRYNTNTTVMWGSGILDFIDERSNKLRDTIYSISWVFSGTLGYIMSELEKQEKSFSQIVRDAKDGWYTEPNPWDDLNGLDVARKLVILARYAGHSLSIEDVQIEALIPIKYWELEWEEFLQAIVEEDDIFQKKIESAAQVGEVLRYVGEMKYDLENNTVKLSVGIKSVPKNSDLWSLSGTANIAIVETEILKKPVPHVIKSRGAGLAVTAGAVRVWIAKMIWADILKK